MNFVSYPDRAEGYTYIHIYIYIYVCVCVCVCDFTFKFIPAEFYTYNFRNFSLKYFFFMCVCVGGVIKSCHFHPNGLLRKCKHRLFLLLTFFPFLHSNFLPSFNLLFFLFHLILCIHLFLIVFLAFHFDFKKAIFFEFFFRK